MNDQKLIWNPYLEGYFEEPRRFLRLWRESRPVHRGINGDWFLFAYEDVKFLLTSPFFKTWKTGKAIDAAQQSDKESKDFEALATVFSKVLLFQDAPLHTELRSLIAKIWSSYALSEFIEEAVDESLALLAGQCQIELIAAYARAVPTRIICKILGLPSADYAEITNWSYQFISALEPFVALPQLSAYNREAIAFHKYLSGEIRRKKTQPDEFFISRLLMLNETLDKPLNIDDIISILCMLFFAGIETSVNLTSQSVLELVKNPEQLVFAGETERLSAAAAGELIRYVSPVNYTKRVAIEDIEIRGCRIKIGESIFGALLSANFDEDVFENPESLDLTRTVNPHLGFGHGAHFCLGARLGREQISRSIPALIRRYPNIALTDKKTYRWDKLIMNRALKTLPVNLNG